MMKAMRLVLLAGLAWLLSGCGIPVPEDKADYVGRWQSDNMSLAITAEGRVEYKRIEGAQSTSVNGPIKQFVGDNFEVGVGPLTTVFEVSQPPRKVDGNWVMVVDGEILIRDQ